MCDCEKWKKNFPKLLAQLLFCAGQSGSPQWTKDNDVFEFCPWCGKRLVEQEDE